MKVSARNVFEGIVGSVHSGTVNAEGALRLIDGEGVPHLITGGDLSLRLDSGAA